jgi:hypothetical protein
MSTAGWLAFALLLGVCVGYGLREAEEREYFARRMRAMWSEPTDPNRTA